MLSAEVKEPGQGDLWWSLQDQGPGSTKEFQGKGRELDIVERGNKEKHQSQANWHYWLYTLLLRWGTGKVHLSMPFPVPDVIKNQISPKNPWKNPWGSLNRMCLSRLSAENRNNILMNFYRLPEKLCGRKCLVARLKDFHLQNLALGLFAHPFSESGRSFQQPVTVFVAKKWNVWCLCWLQLVRTECWIYGEVAKGGLDLILYKLEPHNQVVRGNHDFVNPGRSTAGREKKSLFHHILCFSKQSHALSTSVHTQIFKAWFWGENMR